MSTNHAASRQPGPAQATRMLVCHFAAGDVRQPLPQVNADWDEVFESICYHRLLGLVHRYLRQRPGPEYPPQWFRDKVEQAYQLGTMQMILRYTKIGRVLAAMTAAGIDCIVLKGPALAYGVYPEPYLRQFGDLDLNVHESDWAAVHHLLLSLGFKADIDSTQPPPKLVPQAITEHLQYWHPEWNLLVEVHYNDFLHAGLISRDVARFWDHTVRVDVKGTCVKSLSLEDHLIHLCAHLHHHNYIRLNWFSDLAFIVSDHGAALDWDYLLETIRIEDAAVGVYYSLYFLQELLGVAVPERVLAALRPAAWRCRLHELFMPKKEILSLQPRPYFISFSFYFRPFLRRLLPDLLIMGRRAEKFHYLGRLFTPPADWLIYHYSLKPSHVYLHYILHPLKFFYHLVADVFGAMRQGIWRSFLRVAGSE